MRQDGKARRQRLVENADSDVEACSTQTQHRVVQARRQVGATNCDAGPWALLGAVSPPVYHCRKEDEVS